ncbi:hypothetical genomic island protein [Bartonella henselae str. Houston-1]|uniref:Hypothetical genomic island protein n=1 Tax=Bartonella henselae (strain ATCC 49882 / DSM 28221 / CCUG 30454 / Houston 1) TaxID=283166 RepID=A0A0H3LWM5_BARHE|nr:hypothetical genomic island protein [Bartonella henselae str. Houston-1]
MLTSFGKILRKLRIDHSEHLLDMAIRYLYSIFIFCRNWQKICTRWHGRKDH